MDGKGHIEHHPFESTLIHDSIKAIDVNKQCFQLLRIFLVSSELIIMALMHKNIRFCIEQERKGARTK